MSINSNDLKYRCGRYCAALRKYHELTAKEVADYLGIKENRVLNFERGYTNDSPLLIYYMSLEGFKVSTFLNSIGFKDFING